MKVPFNVPYLPSGSLQKTNPSLRTLGRYYQECCKLLSARFNGKDVVLTPSCTAALELIALTLEIQPGDEVILPSYTYVSTANAFALRGARLIFVDSMKDNPTLDLEQAEKYITAKTKALVIVHYAGIPCDLNRLKQIKKKYNLAVVEDAAHCMGTVANGKQVGWVGDFATYSFHETKNISCGQGGALVVNTKKYWDQVQSISQCGTNKPDFIKGNVRHYSWKTLGSNYLLAEPLCVILLAGLKRLDAVTKKRVAIFSKYYKQLAPLRKKGQIGLAPQPPSTNGHIFHFTTRNREERDQLIHYLRSKGIEAVFHYYPLHLTEFYRAHNKPVRLPNAEFFGDTLVRLPLFYELQREQQDMVIREIKTFYREAEGK